MPLVHDISVNIAPHLTKSRPISHLVDIDPTRHISRSHKTQFYDAIASPKGFSPVLLLTDIISTAVAKHMHKDVLMQVCIEQQESGDRKANMMHRCSTTASAASAALSTLQRRAPMSSATSSQSSQRYWPMLGRGLLHGRTTSGRKGGMSVHQRIRRHAHPVSCSSRCPVARRLSCDAGKRHEVSTDRCCSCRAS